ncbi:transglycosylase SLT domain-containing protein [Microvirga pakistanensis]|uniref:transglycosylase SLT domain-containing protein n=1 Tax=Microvirga pakistanensis TaxID=1682650 RepID=UPI00106AC8F1|nr:transglycosylase SLT domain-containing protein [Microvirga pakistanensis]
MTDEYLQFREFVSEEACLEVLRDLRYGGGVLDCQACSGRHHFRPQAKQRVVVCENCGHALYPAFGTPFEKLRTSLTDWFFAIWIMQTSHALAKELVRRMGMPTLVAERIQRELTAFDALCQPGRPFAGWLTAIGRWIDGQMKSVPGLEERFRKVDLRSAPPNRTGVPSKQLQIASPRFLVLAGGLIGIGFGMTIATLLFEQQSSRDERFDRSIILSPTAPRPLLSLAAVEEDLETVRNAIKAIPNLPAPPPKSDNLPRPLPASPPIASTGNPNDHVTFGPRRVRRHIVEAIIQASRIVGADPTLLMAVADKESSFATEVKARTSSATGLFQFIERTWLGVIKEFGEKHGYAREAAAIVRGKRGYDVPDAAERTRILDLRREPFLSALMAGEMLRKDTLRMESRLRRPLTGGEIYLIHFLGPDGAQEFINAVEDDPGRQAPDVNPDAAEANRAIFYKKEGGRSVSEVHRNFEKMIVDRLNQYQAVRNLSPHKAQLQAPQVVAP